MGAGLTAALMLCGSVSVVAFADEADAAAPAAEDVVAEEVVTEEAAEEEVADIGEIVIEGVGDAADSDVAPEQEIKRISSEEEEVSLSAADETKAGSAIKITDVTVSHTGEDDPYYTVSVAYEYTGDGTATGLDFTIFAYDITTVVDGSIDTEYDTENPVNTPVGWVNQDGMAAKGTTTFKVAKKVNGASLAADSNIAAFDKDSTILIKMGGTDIDTPAAALCSFANPEVGPSVTLGEVDGQPGITMGDVNIMLQYIREKADLTPNQLEAAKVTGGSDVGMADVNKVLQYIREKIDSLD